jgi:hypothetical protein
MPDVVVHGTTHRPRWIGGSDPLRPYGVYEIKVFADENALDGLLPDSATTVAVGDGKFIFAIPLDLDGCTLVRAAGYVTTLGGCTVQIRNVTQGVDMLTDPIVIDAGEYTSLDSTDQPVVDEANALVDASDRISIDVDDAGGAKGLGVTLYFAAI